MSRYGLHVDFYTDPQGHKRVFDILYEFDGTNSLADIAQKLSVPFSTVKELVEQLRRHDLVALKRLPSVD